MKEYIEKNSLLEFLHKQKDMYAQVNCFEQVVAYTNVIIKIETMPTIKMGVDLAETEQKEQGCHFCKTYDFSRAKCTTTDDGLTNIELVQCNTKFPKVEQFKYCPMCGKRLSD